MASEIASLVKQHNAEMAKKTAEIARKDLIIENNKHNINSMTSSFANQMQENKLKQDKEIKEKLNEIEKTRKKDHDTIVSKMEAQVKEQQGMNWAMMEQFKEFMKEVKKNKDAESTNKDAESTNKDAESKNKVRRSSTAESFISN